MDGTLALAQVEVKWQDPDGKPLALPFMPVRLPLLPSTDYTALPEDELVARRLGKIRTAEFQEQAHRAAMEGDWTRVQVLLDELKAISGDNSWSRSMVKELESLMEEGKRDVFTKELRFSASMGSTRISAKDETDDYMMPTSSYLRRKPRQGKTKGTDPDAEPKP